MARKDLLLTRLRVIDALEDIINTFKARGCPEGKELLRAILLRNHLLSHSDLDNVKQSNNLG
jgi:hypothetical protein